MKKLFATILALILVMSMLTGCRSKSAADDFYSNGMAFDSAVTESAGSWDYGWVEEDAVEWEMETPSEEPVVEMAPAAPNAGYNKSENVNTDTLAASQRKIIKYRTVEMQTEKFDDFIRDFERSVTAYGGYISNSSQSGEKEYSQRTANYVVRIPAERFDEFVNEVGALATVTYQNEYIDDVTAKYVDTEARIASLEAQRDAYMKLMEKAETIEEILRIQDYLTDVTYQLESHTAQLNTYKSLISYSTYTLNVWEVKRVTAVVEAKTVWERISANISDNLYDIGEDFKNFFVDFVSSVPYMVVYLLPLAIIVIVIVVVVKKKSKKSKVGTAAPEAPQVEEKAE